MSKTWLKASLVRALRTMAQTAIATIGTQAVRLNEVDWALVLSASLLAGIISVLMAVSGLPEVQLQDTLYDLDNEADDEYMAHYEDIAEGGDDNGTSDY